MPMNLQEQQNFTDFLRNVPVEEVTLRGHLYRIKIIHNKCVEFNKESVHKFFNDLFLQYKKREISASTYNKYRQALHKYCAFKKIENLIEIFPKVKEFKKIKRKMSYEESMAFLNCPQPEAKGKYPSQWKMYTMYWRCMMWIPSRPSEIRKLTKKNFDLKTKTVYILQEKTKDEKEVPIEAALEPFLLEYLKDLKTDLLFTTLYNKNKPISLKSIERDMQKRLEILKIDKSVTPNSLRHSWASRVNANGGSIMGIKELLGHESLKSTMNYIGNDERLLKDTMKSDPFLISYQTPSEVLKSAIKDLEKYNMMSDSRFDPALVQEAYSLLWKSIKKK